MDDRLRAYMYALFSSFFLESPQKRMIQDLRKDPALLEMIGEDTKRWFEQNDDKFIKERLNEDYTTLFLVTDPPFESSVLEELDDVLVGLQNPVMQFYQKSGFDLHLDKTSLQSPDHISIEFAFMQKLCLEGKNDILADFLKTHALSWIPPYLISVKQNAQTPFIKEFCDLVIEFLFSDFDEISKRTKCG